MQICAYNAVAPRNPRMKRNHNASRRAVLQAGLATGAAALAGAARGAEPNPANLPPNVADWTRMLGEGVAARPYGKRAKAEEHIVRRDVPWLTASPQSSV